MAQPNDTYVNQEHLRKDKINKLLRSEDGLILTAYVIELFNRVSSQLKTSRDTVDIHRYQGRLEAYEQILKLREE